jgi:Rrf2 family protein
MLSPFGEAAGRGLVRWLSAKGDRRVPTCQPQAIRSGRRSTLPIDFATLNFYLDKDRARLTYNRATTGEAKIMLSNKAKYGLKAMLYLANRTEATPVGILEIAQDQNIPKKFLDAILLELRRNGIVHSRKGRGGGYVLAKPAGDISVGRIIRVLDGPLAPIACASKTAYRPCADCDVPNCQTRKTMQRVRDAMSEILDHTTLAEMLVLGDAPEVAAAMADLSERL